MELVLRVVFSLLVVLGLIWFLARLARRSSGRRRTDTDAFTVLERRQLSRNASVAIVRVAGKALVLGVTDSHVSMLAEADLAELTKEAAEPVRRTPVPVQGRALGSKDADVIDLDVVAEPENVIDAPVSAPAPALQAAPREPARIDLTRADLDALAGAGAGAGSGAGPRPVTRANGHRPKSLPAAREQVRVRPLPADLPEQKPGKLAGSALSPQTWATAIEVLRARTVRK